MIYVRKAQEDDISGLVKFLIKNDIPIEDKFNGEEYYVCNNDSIVCGFGVMTRFDDYCVIKNVFVDTVYRKNKLGSAIVKTMLNSAELNGAKTAVCVGSNAGFLNYLKFKHLNLSELPDNIRNIIIDDHNNKCIYAVSLIDYFKDTCDCG